MANGPSPEQVLSSDRLRPSFDPIVVARGELHALRGQVAIRYGDSNRVATRVQGTRLYDVTLRYARRVRNDGGALEVSCTCTQAAHHLCEHVWAALRACERRGHLANAARERGALEIVAVRPEADQRLPRSALRWLVDLPSSSPYGGPVIDAYERSLSLVGSPPRIGRAARSGPSFGPAYGTAVRDRIIDLARTGRTDVLFDPERSPEPLVMDEGEPYGLVLIVTEGSPASTSMSDLLVRGELRRGDDILPLEGVSAIFDAGIAFVGARALRFERDAPMRWITVVQKRGELVVPCDEAHRFLRELVTKSRRASFELPPAFELQQGAPSRTHVKVRLPARDAAAARTLHADVTFDYGDGAKAAWIDRGGLVVEAARRRIVVRDRDDEQAAVAELLSAGFSQAKARRSQGAFKIAAARLTPAILALPRERFVVEAQGIVHRTASRKSLSVRSGMDWFELCAELEFDGIPVPMPALIEAAKRGEKLVRLDDGSAGVLPEEWLARVARLMGLSTDAAYTERGEAGRDATALRLRFARTQLSLVDALLGDVGNDVTWEGPLVKLREQLAKLEQLPPVDAPDGFRGSLRDYQRAGLAWMQWLERLGLSGCLADDMGLGKTVQVLALLARRNEERAQDVERRPSLVVAPRSVVHNWIDEAARFAPRLRVRELTSRTSDAEALASDVIVTTYGTLRRRVDDLARLALDYVVLDEAHAIKSAAAITTRAACRLRSRHRLAVTGTPVENHLGELTSLFDFLNPGMLGSRVRGVARRSLEIDPAYGAQLGRGLRPFVLRRTKSDVLTELPPRIDQTIMCVMEERQRSIYDRVRTYYQARLRDGFEADGTATSRLVALEALLRLRQIACHPALVDAALHEQPSAKLDVLLERLAPVVRAGKKAIVFSQFTSLLDLVGRQLEARRISFARLDGKSPNRKALVDRFQNDRACSVFLVSLKAGGVGLNLTAAEYVFILDPWWNPAAEAQAVDRAHRMGQKSTVVAYRLLCKGTIEERVAELQEKKRALVASVFTETEGQRPGTLTVEDVKALLA